MKSWSVDEMLAERPCEDSYPRARLEKLARGRERMTLLEIIDDRCIPAADRVWVACRPGALTAEQLAAWLELIVTRAVTRHASHCGVAEVETWAARWLSGEDRSAEAADTVVQAPQTSCTVVMGAAVAATWTAVAAAQASGAAQATSWAPSAVAWLAQANGAAQATSWAAAAAAWLAKTVGQPRALAAAEYRQQLDDLRAVLTRSVAVQERDRKRNPRCIN